jgi:hypothetical protein
LCFLVFLMKLKNNQHIFPYKKVKAGLSISYFDVPLQLMKKKFAIINLGLMFVILLLTVFQSIHTYQHLAADFLAENHSCKDHEHSHFHQDDEECIICDFTLGFYVAPATFYLRVYNSFIELPYQFNNPSAPKSFLGSMYAHRGPPALV